MITRSMTSLAAGVAAATVLAGCSVLPKPLTQDEITEGAAEKLARVTVDQEPIGRSVDLYEAMARALKYNLDYKVEAMQAALRFKEFRLARYDLLPELVANSGYAARDNFSGGTSVSIPSGVVSRATPTSSQKKRHLTSDVSFSWHVLDFGLSYVRARQAANKVLIARELKRKVIQRIAEDVRTAFWRAVSADRLINKLRRLEGRTRRALANTRKLYKTRETSPITALTYERELVEIKRTIQELQRDLSVAKSQLAALMNVKPGTKFYLRAPHRWSRALRLKLKVRDMIWAAMTHRPELLEVSYKRRINEQEGRAALLELLPGLQLYAGANWDSNDLLYNNNWLNWGAKASWNLIRVFKYPARRRVIEAQDDVLDQRALALTMAVMTQVYVSRVRYYHYRKELNTAGEYYSVQRRLVEQMRVEAAGDRISEQTLIREEMNTLVAEVKYDIAYKCAECVRQCIRFHGA